MLSIDDVTNGSFNKCLDKLKQVLCHLACHDIQLRIQENLIIV